MKCKIAVLFLLLALLLTACSGGKETNTTEETLQETYTVSTEPETAATEATVPATAVPETIPETEPVTEPTDTIAAESVPEDGAILEGYDIVLEQYRDVIRMDSQEYIQLYWNWESVYSYEWLLREDPTGKRLLEELALPNAKTEFPYINHRILFNMHQYKKVATEEELAEAYNFRYACCDLDGNGKEELIICDYSEWGSSLIAVYALDFENTPRVLVNDVGERSHLSLYQDGILCIDGSNSAFEYSCEFYRVSSEWCYLQPLCAFTINTEDPDVDLMRNLLDQFESKLVLLEDFDWKPLFADS